MISAIDDGGGDVALLPPAPPPVAIPAAPPPPRPSPPSSAPARNANGETLEEAEAAVLAEVAAGALGADALIRHPLPPGTSQEEVLRFLASLPQTTYVFGEPGGTVTGPPIGGSGQPGGTGSPEDVAAAALAAGDNYADETDFPGFRFVEVDGGGALEVASSPYRGMAALETIAEACATYRADFRAVIANALTAGHGGGLADGGFGYGPWWLHVTQIPGSPQAGRGANNAKVNRWAWTENGFQYALRAMATSRPSVSGLRGHAAVYAIVYGKARPVDKLAAYKTGAAVYDHLVSLGTDWMRYAADRMDGPDGGGALGAVPAPVAKKKPRRSAGVVTQWRELIGVFSEDIPKARAGVNSVSKSLVEVFK